MKLSQINSYILEDISSVDHPSDFIKDSDYTALVLRLPFMKEGQVDVESFSFIVAQDSIYAYDRVKNELVSIGDFNSFYKRLDTLVDILIEDIKKFHLKIDDLEDLIYEYSHKDVMTNWLQYKQSISLIRRLIFNATIAFEVFLTYYKKEEQFDIHAFNDIEEHLGRVKNLALSAEDRLEHLHDFYKTRVDEKMNKNMYYLTILSGIFMPLTLITGFFGINTGGLPWVHDTHGTFYVVILSVAIEMIFLITFLLMLRKK